MQAFRDDTRILPCRYPEQVTFQPRVNSGSAATAKLKINSPESQLPVEKRYAAKPYGLRPLEPYDLRPLNLILWAGPVRVPGRHGMQWTTKPKIWLIPKS